MNYRVATLLAEESLTGSGTKTIDINVTDVISRIMFSWRVTKSQHAMNSYAHKDITKIELVDGSDALHSLDGGQNQAVCIYDRKCPSMNHGQHMTSLSEYSTYAIDFGRYLYDPQLALDPRKFNNLQLKISYDVDVSDTGVTTGYLEVWAYCFDEKMVTPIGFLSTKDFESWSLSAAAAYHYVDLPTDLTIRKLFIQGYRASYEPWYQVMGARLSEDNDKRVPFDWELEDYYRIMKGIWTPVTEEFEAQVDTTGAAYYLTPTDYYATLVAMSSNVAGYPYSTGGYFKGGVVTLKASATSQLVGIARGYLPNHVYEFPFGDPNDLGDWYDVTRLGSLRLRLLSGTGTSGNVDTILQQLRKY